jgi:hypothetical protein
MPLSGCDHADVQRPAVTGDLGFFRLQQQVPPFRRLLLLEVSIGQ